MLYGQIIVNRPHVSDQPKIDYSQEEVLFVT